MEAKHTPGPWEANEYAGGCWEVCANETGICLVDSCIAPRPIGLEEAEIQANACLIAAAPDLLSALVALVEVCPECDGKGITPKSKDPITESIEYGPCPYCDTARAAITKARGE